MDTEMKWLYHLINTGNVSKIKEKLAENPNIIEKGGFDINMMDKVNGKQAIHYAVTHHKKSKILDSLLQKEDIEVNNVDEAGFTALHYAAMKISRYINLRSLLSSGKVDLNILDKHGRTALHVATLRHVKELTIKLLINNGIDINRQDKTGKTALHYACLKKRQSKKKLIQMNKKRKIKNEEQSKATKRKYSKDYIDTARENMITLFLSVKGINVNIKDNIGKTPLHYAVSIIENDSVLQLLVTHPNISLNEKDSSGKTPLHYCALHQDEEMLKKLLTCANIDVNIKDDIGQTVLHNSAKVTNNIDIIKMIVQQGNKLASMQDQNGFLPSCYAMKNGENDIHKFLIEKNEADNKCNDSTDNGMIIDCSLDAVKQLTCSDFKELNFADDYERTCIHKLCSSSETSNHEKVKHFFEVCHACVNSKDILKKTCLHYAIHKSKSVPFVTYLLCQPDLDVNAQDINGKTVLHYASMNVDQHAMVQTLLENKHVDLNVLDSSKKTSLHHACSISGNEETIKILLNHTSIELHHVDENGRTVLHYCCIVGCDIEIINIILNFNDFSLMDKLDHNGKSALGYAVLYKHKHISDIISQKTVIHENYEPTVYQLNRKDIKKLNGLNNECLQMYKWEQLCYHLNEKDYVKFSAALIQLLKHPGSAAIGDTVVKNILSTHPEFTVYELWKIAKGHKRNDICLLLRDSVNALLQELDSDIYFELTILLSKKVGISDWKDLVEEIKFDECRIQQIELAYKDEQYQHGTSTEEMFNYIQKFCPTLKLAIIYECLVSLKINDVAGVLENVIQDKIFEQ